jgi:hypothetical protein
MKLISTLFLGAALLLSSCDKKESVIENREGTIHVSSSSVCNVYIQLDAGGNIYPVNSEKVATFLTEGRRVTVSYRPTSEFVSPCPNAPSAIIEEIR